MNIRLIDVNSKHENLALRKLKAYYGAKGHNIGYDIKNPDRVYISIVFPTDQIELPKDCLKVKNIYIGGPGYDVKTLLPPEIEHTCPDYEGLNYSMGRTSWGCPRKCPFCMTWKMEGIKTIEHSPFDEFVRHKNIVLYDANFLDSPNVLTKLELIEANKWKVNFNQGLDVRFVNPAIAQVLKNIKTYTFGFNRNRIHIAWDNIRDESPVCRGIELLLNAGITPGRVMCYILVGYYWDKSKPYDFEADMYRFKKILNYGLDPYIQIYNNRRDMPIIRHFARYVNQRIYKRRNLTFMDYFIEKTKLSGLVKNSIPLDYFGKVIV